MTSPPEIDDDVPPDSPLTTKEAGYAAAPRPGRL
jgi:hypothetical protein